MERLPGGMGNGGQVARVGDVVVRPCGPYERSTTALLRSLTQAGFPAPVPLGEGDAGRQRFEWIEGDVGVPPFPAWVMTEQALASAGRLLRRYHDNAVELELSRDLSWSDEMADPRGGTIICHNDVCPENVVYRDGEAFALFDFDFAAPGRPLWDLAQMARMWSPLRPPELVVGGMQNLDPFRRLSLLAAAYGVNATERAAFIDIIVESSRQADRFVRRQLAAREPAFVDAWKQLGGEDALGGILDWCEANRAAMLAALK